jgi:integron integrase
MPTSPLDQGAFAGDRVGPATGTGRPLPALRSVRLLDQLRERIRMLHYSRRTEQAYVHWCRAFIRFNGIRHPLEMGAPEVQAFLSWLAVDRRLSASTHRQALSALVFLFSKVLGLQLPWMAEIGRPRERRRLPVVLSQGELAMIFRCMEGEHRLMAQLLYGTGMRLMEGLSVRVKDLDFAHQAVVVRHGKGGKDRVLMLPQRLVPALREQLGRAHMLWAKDQADGRGGVEMPDALERKYEPVRNFVCEA